MGDISAGPQLSDILEKAVLSILSPSIVAHKDHRGLDCDNMSYGLHTQQRQ